jgi:hypothetical protein
LILLIASSDNCQIASEAALPATVSCADIGPVNVQGIVTDLASRSASCTTTIQVRVCKYVHSYYICIYFLI